MGCATAPTPDAAVDLAGEWRVTAVNGVVTPSRSDAFNFRFTPPTGSARFGCNAGGGSARVENGWLVTGDWISTVAGCPDARMAFEREGFSILGVPAAIEATASGAVRLRNERGTITLRRN